jgi:hypothetical protein
MNKKEVATLLKTISTYYGSKFKVDDPQGTLNAWHKILSDYEFSEIEQNLTEYVKNNKFPPAVADIITIESGVNKAVPTYDETRAMFEKWENDKKEIASKEVAEKALSNIRDILGIKRGKGV